nr:DNA polymerase III subunit delta [Lachnospiraceae bacterium]
MKKIKEDIKNNKFESVYLLYGEEAYMRQLYKNKIKNAVIPEGDTMNILERDSDAIDLKEIVEFATTMPFFADHHLVILKDSGLFTAGREAEEKEGEEGKAQAESLPEMKPGAEKNTGAKGKGKAAKGAPTKADPIIDYINNPTETTVLVFVETKVDKRSKLFKAINEKGYVCEMARRTVAELVKFIGQTFKQGGRAVTEADATFLVDYVGMDMQNLVNEMEKLIAYTDGKDVVTKEDILKVCVEENDEKVYNLTGAIARKKKEEAFAVYDDMLKNRESPMMILYAIQKQYRNLLIALEARKNNMDKYALSGLLGIKPYPAELLLKDAR